MIFERIGRRDGPGPFEFTMLPFLAFGGISAITHIGAPTSLSRVLPSTVLLIWAFVLSVGSVIGFIGVSWWGRETTALIIEQVGLIAVAGATMIYAIGLISQLDTVQGATVLTSFVGGVGTASTWRVVQIYNRQREFIKVSRDFDDSESSGK